MANIGLDGPYVQRVSGCPALANGIVNGGGLNRVPNFGASALDVRISIFSKRKSLEALAA